MHTLVAGIDRASSRLLALQLALAGGGLALGVLLGLALLALLCGLAGKTAKRVSTTLQDDCCKGGR